MFDLAPSGPGYDKVVVLETGVTYTGGLWMGKDFNRLSGKFEGRERDVRIECNGAILDLQGREICIAYCTNRLDIDDCVIINGDVRYCGHQDGSNYFVPEGSVRYVTFYQGHDYGVRLFGSGADILVERCIVVDAIDTGPDFLHFSGVPSDWMPTGSNFTLSMQAGGIELYDNWSFHSDPKLNSNPLRHFLFLCDYG